MKVVILLLIANVFMTFAWYGHLKHTSAPLVGVIIISWLIAGLEYVFQVPANRIGAQSGWSGFQLKITQEVITIAVFVVFAVLYLKEPVRWNHAAAFAMLIGAVVLVFGVSPRKAQARESLPVAPAASTAPTSSTDAIHAQQTR